MSNDDVGTLSFRTVSAPLSDQSKVWSVQGRVKRPSGETAKVLECHCVDERHADKLLELLDQCVEIESFRAPIEAGLEVVKT